MGKQTLDFTDITEYELKTLEGTVVLREPRPLEYFEYLEKVQVEGQNVKDTYNLYIDYFITLGGDKKVLTSLTINQLFKVAELVNGGEVKK